MYRISYMDYQTNEYLWNMAASLATVKRRKLALFENTVLQGTLEGGRAHNRRDCRKSSAQNGHGNGLGKQDDDAENVTDHDDNDDSDHAGDYNDDNVCILYKDAVVIVHNGDVVAADD
ncbi:hypothetical protein DPMN_066310 [Dreissena polymorpha]|uniref:Uncharacterized protein n=1 Tax=Dreissena polymorpha TaxID=45954 RepID=A0A9D3YYQ9_DREPO|nr:hypothetical protein DPMN_066310 [Dreissena polymorpha]